VLICFIRKKCRKSYAVMEEKAVVFPNPVARGGDQRKQLDLTNDSRSYVSSGFFGRSTQMTGPGRSPVEIHDGRPDPSSAALIDVSDVGLTPKTSASGSLGTMYCASTRVDEVGRQASQPITGELVNVLPEYMA